MQQGPHPARGPPHPSTPWKDPSATVEDREHAERGSAGRKPARRERQTQTGRECKERAMLSTGQVQALGHRVPTAAAPKRAPGSPPAGAAIGSHLLPVRGRVPRPLHQRWAEMGCDTRLSPEAVSTEGDTGSCPRAWPTTASNTEQAAALLRGLCGCRGQAGIGGPPRGAPSPWVGVPDGA